jgi:PAS domain S-box-containing protein
MSIANRSQVSRYTFTILAVTLATFLRFALTPFLNLEVPFILYFPTVVLCAWFGGLGPGLLSTALGGLASLYFFFPPQFSLAISEPTALAQVITFSLAGALISIMAENLHRSRRRTEESEAMEREQSEKLRITLASIGDAVITTDAQGRVTFMNRVAESLTGWKQEDASSRPLTDVFNVVNEQTRQTVENPALWAMREDRVVSQANHTALIARDGTERPIADSGAPIKDREGRTIGAVLVFHDITERKRAEEARAYLAAIVEHSRDPVISKSIVGIVTSWNSAAEALFGYSADEMVGQSIRRIIPPELMAEEDEILNRLAAGQSIEHFETERITKTGQRVPVSLTISPIKDATGQIVGASKVVRDITELKQAEEERSLLLASERAAREQAEAANRAKDEFVAMISHEIRSPLSSILGWTQMLRASEFDQKETARILEVIERNAMAQLQIIEDLLDISRVITGKLILNVSKVELTQVIEGAMDSIGPAADAKGIQLRTRLEARGVVIPGDPVRLQQIIWNLLSNAVKFTPSGGRVEVRLERVASNLQITVSDSGPGIDPEFLPFVFDRFSQASDAGGRRYGGLGLGLAIVRHLAELHGGTVRADSPGGGQGATFTVTLPVKAVREEKSDLERAAMGADQADAFTASIRLDGLRVMIVDDDAETRDLLTVMLTRHGAEAQACASAAEALKEIERLPPSVLVSDIRMLDEDGYSLIRKLRALGPEQGGRIPAVALTAYAGSEDRLRAMSAGFNMHVPKPIEEAELIVVVASLAGRLDDGHRVSTSARN